MGSCLASESMVRLYQLNLHVVVYSGDENENYTGVVSPGYRAWLLLDSRVVDVPMTYDLTFDMLLSLKPFFFNSLKIRHDSQTTLKHKTLESNKSDKSLC